MTTPARRRSRILSIAITLAGAGLMLLVAWMYSVTAYGFEVDDRGLVADVRAQDIALVSSGTAMLVAAAIVAITQRRIARRAGSS